MGVPNPLGIKLSGSLGSVGPISVSEIPVAVSGIPSTFDINIDKLPKILVGIDKIQVGLDKLQIGVDPLQLGVAITSIPSIRAHVPTHYTLGLKVFGLEVLCLKLCGETQVITEPYVPNPAERCGHGEAPTPVPLKRRDVAVP